MKRKWMSIFLAIAMVLGMMPAAAFAADPADPVTVYLTVSNKGVLASDNGGEVMANREVTVTDLDGSGQLTYDEALAAAHKAYNSESGFDAPGGWVSKLWGVDTYNSLFFKNNAGISGIATETVSEGDYLTASINADDVYYADWYTYFDKNTASAQTGEKVSLTLNGFQGMAMSPKAVCVSGAAIQLADGTLLGKTDDDGKVSVSFDKAGTYVVTASGSVSDTVTDWSSSTTLIADCPIIAPACTVEVTEAPASPDGTAFVRIVGSGNKDFITWTEAPVVSGKTTLKELTEAALAQKGASAAWSDYGFLNSISGCDIGSDYWMSMLNDSGAAFNTDNFNTIAAKDGDRLVLYAYGNGDYAWISATESADVDVMECEGTSYITGKGAFDLTASGYDENWSLVDYKVAGATVTVKNADASSVSKATLETDENGAFNIDFYGNCATADLDTYSQTYDLYAEKEGINTAFCRVTLTKDGLSFSQPEGDAGKEDETVIKTDVAVDDLLAGIAAGYAAESSLGAWEIMEMGAYEDYLPSTASKVSEAAMQAFIDDTAAKVTAEQLPGEADLAKMILALQAQGYDPAKVYPVDSSKAVDLFSLLKGMEHSKDSWTAAFTMAAFAQNADAKETGKAIALSVLADQAADGSWNSWGSTVDATANMIAGLAFYSDDTQVAAAIEKAIAYLASAQKDNGVFDSWGYGADANTEAIVAIGLAAGGADPASDTRFQKGEIFALDGLLQFALADNSGFGYQDNTAKNASSTEQGFRGLLAAAGIAKSGKAFNVYDFSANTDLKAARATGSGGSSGGKTPTGDDITVKVSVQTLDGYWLRNYSLTIPGDGATAYYALTKAFDANQIEYKVKSGDYIYQLTYDGTTMSEFDEGPNSGWLYKLNGKVPTTGTSGCNVKNGDTILFYYTKDWTKDSAAMANVPKDTLPTEKEAGPFIDVKDSDWYSDAAKKAAELGLFAGFEAGTDADGKKQYEFRGSETMTRGMFVTVLRAMQIKLKGSAPEAPDAGFADVEDGAWYEEGVNWAIANGIAAGKGEVFGVEDPVTREQMAVFLYLYAKQIGKVSAEPDLGKLDAFTDADSIADYAKTAMAWLAGEGLLAGRGSGRMAPAENSTRAEVAAFFVSCYEYLSK